MSCDELYDEVCDFTQEPSNVQVTGNPDKCGLGE